MTQLALVIDLNVCVGCHACVTSCKEWNTSGTAGSLSDMNPYSKDPTGTFFNRVQTFEVGSFPNTETVHFPKSCLHCEDPPCVPVCPTGASSTREADGIVLVDCEKCIGCKYCSWACPYGARELDEEQKIMKKCTLCVDRIYDESLPESERKPACVNACPTEARLFGDVNDPDSEVSRAIREQGGYQLMPEWGTQPANHYLPRRKAAITIHEDELVRADNPLKKERKLPMPDAKDPTLDETTSWKTMHPAFSVIFLTTLIGAGQGFFLALYTSQLYAVFRVLPDQDPVNFSALGGLISLVFLVLGLLSSFFHLGRPERAWRSAARWRTSWLSREVIALPAFMAMAGAWVFIQYSGWNPHLFALGMILNIDLSLFIGAMASLFCLALFLFTGMIYACIKQLQEWATPLTVVNYTLLGLASGFVLATAFASVNGVGLTDFFGGWAIVLTIVAFIFRTASLVRNARLKYKSTMETAIGIRHTQIKQKAQGSMAGSFNTREFFHGARERNFRFVKWIFLLLVFPLPVVLLSVGLVTQMTALLFAAFLVQYIGLLAERWFFFAQANHPQNLYYQTV